MLGCQHLLFTSYKILLDLYFTSSSEANHSSNESPVLIQLKSAILLQSCANPFLSTMLWTTICNIMHSFRCMGRIFTTKSSGFVHVCMPQCRCSLGDVLFLNYQLIVLSPPPPHNFCEIIRLGSSNYRRKGDLHMCRSVCRNSSAQVTSQVCSRRAVTPVSCPRPAPRPLRDYCVFKHLKAPGIVAAQSGEHRAHTQTFLFGRTSSHDFHLRSFD